MNINVGDKCLLTTNNWFRGPDGEQYNAVHGTVKAVLTAEETLGVKTNRGSTNWYVEIGNMTIAGCQIFYCIQTDVVSYLPPKRGVTHEGILHQNREDTTLIYDADA